jgi:hypothetical protein
MPDPWAVPNPPSDPGDQHPEWQKARFDALLRNWEDAAKTGRAGAVAEAKAESDAALALRAAERAAKLEREKAISAANFASDSAERDLRIELDKAEQAADIALEKLDLELDADLLKAFHKTLTEATEAVLERSKQAAEYVQTIATAIAALYTGILAFAAVGASKTLPARGLIPVVFLGAAMALAAGYRGFLGRPDPVNASFDQPSRRAVQLARTAFLGDWMNRVVLARGAFLRGAVVSLGFGAAFLPIGIVESPGIEALAWRWAAVAAFVLASVLVWQFLLERVAAKVPKEFQALTAGAAILIALVLIVGFQEVIRSSLRQLVVA